MSQQERPVLPRRRRLHRTGLQRLVLGFNSVIVVGALMTAGMVWWTADKANSTQRIAIPELAAAPAPAPGSAGTVALGGPAGDTLAPGIELETFPAQNWLVTSSDSRAIDCIDPNSPYAGAFRQGRLGESERADTIMIFRIDTENRRAAILSLQRDLWVKIGNRNDRINSVFDSKKPSQLIKTIKSNFGISIDHYATVNFCAFKDLVDSLDGIRLYFANPTRDRNTGLNVLAGCQQLNGDAALAYARSRHLQEQKKGKWVSDETGDLGRVTRQQQLVKRLMRKAIATGPTDPGAVADILDDLLKNIAIDDTINNRDLISLALQLRSIDPGSIPTFQPSVNGKIIDEKSVLLPTKSRFNQDLYEVFQGKKSLSDPLDAATDASSAPGTGVGTAPVPGGNEAPAVSLEQEQIGVVPADVEGCPP
jgi:LCP family protein required for cell wall assembly